MLQQFEAAKRRREATAEWVAPEFKYAEVGHVAEELGYAAGEVVGAEAQAPELAEPRERRRYPARQGVVGEVEVPQFLRQRRVGWYLAGEPVGRQVHVLDDVGARQQRLRREASTEGVVVEGEESQVGRHGRDGADQQAYKSMSKVGRLHKAFSPSRPAKKTRAEFHGPASRRGSARPTTASSSRLAASSAGRTTTTRCVMT